MGHKHKIRILAGITTLASLLFVLVLVNSYYRFYPTLYAVFGKSNVQNLGASQDSVAIQYTAKASGTANTSSIEQSLDSLSKQPTSGKVFKLDIPGTTSKFIPRAAYVYEPAIASTLPNTKLPVIVLSAGFPGIPENWLGSGLEQTMDAFAEKHKGITPIIFMIDNTGSLTNDTECVNSPHGQVETYMTTDVPNYIKSHFSVSANPANWAIGGLSMGGMCSIMLTLRHPDVYHYFDDIAGEIGPEVGSQQKTIDDLFGGSTAAWTAHQPDLLLKSHTYNGLGGFFGVGRDDTLEVTDAEHTLYSDAEQAGVQSVYEDIAGQHTFDVWQQLFKDSLPWLSNRIGATVCGDTSCS
jgi:S-formylglutathione hydrolase FrmB